MNTIEGRITSILRSFRCVFGRKNNPNKFEENKLNISLNILQNDILKEVLRDHAERSQREYAAKILVERGETKSVVQYMSDKEKNLREKCGAIYTDWIDERDKMLRIIDETDPRFLYKFLTDLCMNKDYKDYRDVIKNAMQNRPFGLCGYAKTVESTLTENPQEGLRMLAQWPGLISREEIYSIVTKTIESTLIANPREGLRMYRQRPRIAIKETESTEASINSILRRLAYFGEDVDLRIETIRAMHITNQDLIFLLGNDHEPRVRYCVADLLGGSSIQRIFLSPAIESALKTALRDKDPELRKHASESLARGIGFPGRSVLIDALDDPDPDVKKLALETLQKYHDPERFCSPVGPLHEDKCIGSEEFCGRSDWIRQYYECKNCGRTGYIWADE